MPYILLNFFRNNTKKQQKCCNQSIDTRYRFKPPKLATKNQHASRNKFVVITRYKITISVGDSGSHTFPFVASQKFENSIDTVIIHIVHFTQVFFSKMQRNSKTAISSQSTHDIRFKRPPNLVFNTNEMLRAQVTTVY